MPKTLKDLFLDKDYDVPFVEAPKSVYKNDIVDSKVIESEVNTKGILLQFAKNLPKIYGTDLVRIESRGSIDPARTLSVNSARPETGNGGGFGRLLGNLLGQGGAYRPSDTIFENSSGAPVSKGGQPVNGDWNSLKYAVEDNKDYIISQHPTKPNALASALNGLAKGNNPQEMAKEAVGRAVGLAQQQITKGLNSVLTLNRKKVKPKQEKQINDFTNNAKASDYIRMPVRYDEKGESMDLAGLKKRADEKITSFNSKLADALGNTLMDDEKLNKAIANHSKSGITYLQFKLGNQILVLPAALNGDVAETVNADWNKFQYAGSPFHNYRYSNVERQIRISFKVYWLTDTQQEIMRAKLSYLRGYAFPNSNLSTIKLGQNRYTPLAFTPNIVQFSLGDYYKNMNVIVTNVQLGVPQVASWASTNPEFTAGTSIIYPTVVDVSMDMTVIETHKQEVDKITYQMDYVYENPVDYVYTAEPQTETARPPVKQTQSPKRKNTGKPKAQTPQLTPSISTTSITTGVEAGTYVPTVNLANPADVKKEDDGIILSSIKKFLHDLNKID